MRGAPSAPAAASASPGAARRGEAGAAFSAGSPSAWMIDRRWGNMSKIGISLAKILQIFGGLVLGCISEILQENMRLTAFFKLYKICILLHRCDLKILAKNRFEKSAIFLKIQQNFANVAKSARFFRI